MSFLHLKHADFAGWSDALWIEAEHLALILVPQIGGRVIGLRWDQQDLFWVNHDLAGESINTDKLQNPAVDKVDLGFLLWGGNKTWLAPQEHWRHDLPFVDLDSGAYTMAIVEDTANRVTIALKSPICRESSIQITRTITVQSTCWSITHQFENYGDSPVSWGVWSNSMVRRPAQVFLPLGSESDFDQGVKTFINEGNSVKARSRVIDFQPDMAVIQCEAPAKFKYGVDSDQGTVLTVMRLEQGQYIGWVSQFATSPTEVYGHGCTAEVFNAADYDYLEVEIYSPVRSLNPGETFTFTETNRLVPLDSPPTLASDVMALKLLGELC